MRGKKIQKYFKIIRKLKIVTVWIEWKKKKKKKEEEEGKEKRN